MWYQPGNHFLQSLLCYHARRHDLCAWVTTQGVQEELLVYISQKNLIALCSPLGLLPDDSMQSINPTYEIS